MDPIAVPIEQGLALASILFAIGLTGVMVRRNIIVILMSLEVMLMPAPWHSSLQEPNGGRLMGKSCSC